MAEYTDVALNTDAGYYDISFTDGDLTKLQGFDTAIYISIFTDARASETQIEQPERRRGWIGNLGNAIEIGSLNWLYEQARLINATANGLADTTRTCLKWLVDFEYATSVTVTPVRSGANTLDADIRIAHPDGSVESKRVSLWGFTPNG
jgi:phage gp46-like protein